MSQDWTFLTKFIIVGEQSVGKSAILIRLTEQRFLYNTEATIGVEFGSHLLTLDNGDRIKIQVWDTAGSEAFRSITRSYYRGAAGALLVFSLVHRPSFLHIQEWLDDVREHAEESVSIVLVGNMADLALDPSSSEAKEDGAGAQSQDATAASSSSSPKPSKSAAVNTVKARDSKAKQPRARQVTREEAEQFAKKEGLIYVETSAKTGQNIEEAFTRAAKEVHRKFLAAQAQQGQDSGNQDGSAAAGSSMLRRNAGGAPGTGAASGSGSSASASGRGIDLTSRGDGTKSGCCVIV
ncbi:hypothetical protein OC861_002645 [Tilletia horrida]|nr:hypothetical protein OC861_002645 [Tilletia horrida]